MYSLMGNGVCPALAASIIPSKAPDFSAIRLQCRMHWNDIARCGHLIDATPWMIWNKDPKRMEIG
jgi:hypothetical protein